MNTKNEALKALLVLFNSFQVFGSAAEKEEAMEAYWAVLSDLPAEDVIRVCIAASRGEIGDGKRLPPAAQLFQAARPMAAKKIDKPSPDWRPHQDRFLNSSGTLYVTEGGKQTIYTAEELRDWGYAMPKALTALNREQLLERGVKPIRRIGAESETEKPSDERVAGLIEGVVKGSAV